jgi:hypothetical protein
MEVKNKPQFLKVKMLKKELPNNIMNAKKD